MALYYYPSPPVIMCTQPEQLTTECGQYLVWRLHLAPQRRHLQLMACRVDAVLTDCDYVMLAYMLACLACWLTCWLAVLTFCDTDMLACCVDRCVIDHGASRGDSHSSSNTCSAGTHV